jgi:uncharacterized protein (DUF2147 family)
MTWRKLVSLCAIATIMTVALALDAQKDKSSPIGRWKTIDDVTKEVKSIVKISIENGKLVGSIEQLFRKPNEEQDPKCDKCAGEKKDKRIIGMRILWDLTENKDEWSGGRILDPKNGKEYSCKLKTIEGGTKLEVRGFLGISLLGRTQIWIREDQPAE